MKTKLSITSIILVTTQVCGAMETTKKDEPNLDVFPTKVFGRVENRPHAPSTMVPNTEIHFVGMMPEKDHIKDSPYRRELFQIQKDRIKAALYGREQLQIQMDAQDAHQMNRDMVKVVNDDDPISTGTQTELKPIEYKTEKTIEEKQLMVTRALEKIINEREEPYRKRLEICELIEKGQFEEATFVWEKFEKSGNRYLEQSTVGQGEILRQKASKFYHLRQYDKSIVFYSHLFMQKIYRLSDSINLIDAVLMSYHSKMPIEFKDYQKNIIKTACNHVLESNLYRTRSDREAAQRVLNIIEKM